MPVFLGSHRLFVGDLHPGTWPPIWARLSAAWRPRAEVETDRGRTVDGSRRWPRFRGPRVPDQVLPPKAALPWFTPSVVGAAVEADVRHGKVLDRAYLGVQGEGPWPIILACPATSWRLSIRFTVPRR